MVEPNSTDVLIGLLVLLMYSVVGVAIVLGGLYLVLFKTGLVYWLYMKFAKDPDNDR